MKQPVFEGLATAIVTPFRNGTIDIPTFEHLLDAQIAAGGILHCVSDERELFLCGKRRAFACGAADDDGVDVCGQLCV